MEEKKDIYSLKNPIEDLNIHFSYYIKSKSIVENLKDSNKNLGFELDFQRKLNEKLKSDLDDQKKSNEKLKFDLNDQKKSNENKIITDLESELNIQRKLNKKLKSDLNDQKELNKKLKSDLESKLNIQKELNEKLKSELDDQEEVKLNPKEKKTIANLQYELKIQKELNEKLVSPKSTKQNESISKLQNALKEKREMVEKLKEENQKRKDLNIKLISESDNKKKHSLELKKINLEFETESESDEIEEIFSFTKNINGIEKEFILDFNISNFIEKPTKDTNRVNLLEFIKLFLTLHTIKKDKLKNTLKSLLKNAHFKEHPNSKIISDLLKNIINGKEHEKLKNDFLRIYYSFKSSKF